MKRLIGIVTVLIVMIVLPMQGQRKDLSGLKFCIDPGHGGHSSNDRPPVYSDIPFWESDGNFAKALMLKPMLEARGATVFLTRYINEYTIFPAGSNPADDEPSLSARYTVANQNNVNWFHSIHSNATGGTNTSTNYTLILLKENTSTRLAQWPEAMIMSDRLWKQIQGHHRTASSYWVRTDYTFYGGPTGGGFNLGVLNGAAMPCELSEGSFHDYQSEARRLMNNEYRKDEAYAICTAFMEYFGADYDTLGMIGGTQTDPSTGKGVSNGTIRLLPVDKVYHTDQYANGFFYFDSLAPGTYTVHYETPGLTTPDGIVTVMSNTPAVSGSLPAADAMGVPRMAPFTITFLKPMSDTAMVRSKLSITPAMPGTITWSNNNTVLTYTPTQPRPFKTLYTVNLDMAAKTPPSLSFVDNGTVSTSSLSSSYRFSFTTENLPPYISLTQPKANDTAFTVTKQIAVRFSDIMDTTIARKAFSIKPAVEGTFSWTNGGLNLFFTPAKPLPYSSTFTVTIDSTAKSLNGGTLDQNRDTVSNDTYTFSFRTAADPTAVDTKDSKLPREFALTQNFPNPFNPTTNFEVHVPAAGMVSVKVFDMLGREVKTLVNERLAPGIYSYTMNASDLASGVYFYRMQAGAFVQTKRMIVQK